MNPKAHSLAFFLTFIMLVQLACNLPAAGNATPDAFATLNGLYTAAALTEQADSAQPVFTATPGLPPPTLTSIPFFATQTLPPSTPVPLTKCDAAQFVSDLTYADGSVLARNTSFVKIWRIKNVGSCSWTTSYALVFTGGDLMNGPLHAALEKNVNPGETIDIAISFTTPNKDGHYRSYWKLRNASGLLFGLGEQADTAFWADVNVLGKSHVAYDFAANYCGADWKNNNGALSCPGTRGDASGFALRLNSPTLENGKTEDESALLLSPLAKKDGSISGQFPNFEVKAGDRFRAVIGCEFDYEKCNVVFRLDYKYNGQVKTLGKWYEIYEGLTYPIDLDLSSLAGKSVKFILVVEANGFNSEDYALWLAPRITRQGTAPTATPTLPPPTSTATPIPPTLTFTVEPPTATVETPTETLTP